MKTAGEENISRLPASRFPEYAEVYFCDNCGRDLTKNLYHDRAPVWQPLRPVWCACQCGRKFLSGAAEWDDLTPWERKQRTRQLRIGFWLLALLVVPVTLVYLALRYGGAALLVVVGIALIPSILVVKPLGFVLVDVYEIIASTWRTRVLIRAETAKPRLRSDQYNLPLIPVVIVVAVLIVATGWIPSHSGSASPMAAVSSRENSSADLQETLLAPAKLPLSVTPQTAIPGAPSSAFRRVRVGPNEVDYIAEDVTIRHFAPTLTRRRAKLPYKEVHFGEDVTTRYFASRSNE